MEEKLRKLKQDGNSYSITAGRSFDPQDILDTTYVYYAGLYAYNMPDNQRPNRKDGKIRAKLEMMLNDYIGKCGEFAVYQKYVKNRECVVSTPDCNVYERGVWDSGDMLINGERMSIKTIKHFSNLLLLEKTDYDKNGEYKFIKQKDKGIILVRLRYSRECEDKIKALPEDFSFDDWENTLRTSDWEYELCGYCTSEDIQKSMQQGLILPRRALLNGRMPMDVDNYYIQVGDLRPIEDLEFQPIEKGYCEMSYV